MRPALRILLIIFLSLLAAGQGHAQLPDGPYLSWEDFVEEYLAAQDGEAEAVSDEELDRLEERALHPLQLNRLSRADLLQLPFIDEAQADSILSYRLRKRGFRSLGELQFIRGVDYFTRRYLSLFVRCDSLPMPDDSALRRQLAENRIAPKLHRGAHEAETRLDIPLYQRKGYKRPAAPTATNYYFGNNLRHIVRYRYAYKREVAYGFTLEKDPGEPVGKEGFYPYDYLSGYLFLRPQGKPWSFVAGDFDLANGRGLLLGKVFYAGREQLLRTSQRPAFTFRPHTSTDEANFFRGGAFGWQRSGWDVAGFVSYRRLDARLEEGTDTVRTILGTGLHRTFAEISRRRTLGSIAAGVHAGFNRRNFGVGLSGYTTRYDHPVYPTPRFYNRYYFRGQTAGGLSATYHFAWKRWSVQGETALDHDLHVASENVFALRFSSRLRLHAQYRHFSPRFVSLYGSALQQASRVANEQGLWLGLRYLPLPAWELTGYADIFRFPKPTYSSVLPDAKGMEIGVQSTSALPAGWNLTLRYRLKSKQHTITGYRLLEYRSTHRWRVAVRRTQPKWELNTQLDATFTTRQTGHRAFGWMWSARTVWKPVRRFSLKAFASLFFTDDYETAAYAYEPQLRRAAAFAACAYHGVRSVCLFDYQAFRTLTLSLRFASTHYFNRSAISSGTERIASSWKNDLSLQVRWLLPLRAVSARGDGGSKN